MDATRSLGLTHTLMQVQWQCSRLSERDRNSERMRNEATVADEFGTERTPAPTFVNR